MDIYSLTKTLHIFFVLVWMSGVLMNAVMLSLFKYSANSFNQATLVQFHKLDRWIANPAQGFAWAFGLGLILMGGWFPDAWLLAKLVCVIFLAALHGVQSAALRKISRGQNTQRRLGIVQRMGLACLPVVFAIIFLVVNKPF